VNVLRAAAVEIGYGLDVVWDELEQVVGVVLIFCGRCGLKETTAEDRVW
jgi:hypothetical protein